MATVGYTSYEEARSEEEEFYHFALNTSIEDHFQSEGDQTVDDWLNDEAVNKRRENKYPQMWNDHFYDPFCSHARL